MKSKEYAPSATDRSAQANGKSLFVISSVVGIVLTSSLVFGYVLKTITQVSTQEGDTIYPTAIPGIDDQRTCEQTGRQWQEGMCQDYHYSHIL